MLRLSSQTQQSRVRAQLELLLRKAEPGERLPSEPALAKRFGVSRTTIREVMSQLEAEGFIQRRQGSGTYVSRQPLLEDESLLHFVDFPTLISKQGYTPAMQQLGFVQQRAGTFFSTRFHIGEEDRILTRRCLYTADEHFCVLKTASRLRSFQKVNVCICWSQTTPIYGFSFFAQPAVPPVRTKPQSLSPDQKTTRSLNPCLRTSSILCSF